VAGLVAQTDWANLTLAGAFLVGAALATVATLRVVRHVTAFFSKVERERHGPPGDKRDLL
jgi:hypothetical protein